MRAMLCAALALTIIMMGLVPARAAAVMTGNDIYRGCELLVHPPASPPPAGDILVQGYCAGAVTAVVATNHRSGRRRGAAVPGHAFRSTA
jgi:hypothetical protein